MKYSESRKNIVFKGKSRGVLKFVERKLSEKNPHVHRHKTVYKHVDNVDNYLPNNFSPTFTISPAPIVINKSPFEQFSNKKVSISSKDGK